MCSAQKSNTKAQKYLQCESFLKEKHDMQNRLLGSGKERSNKLDPAFGVH